MTGIGMISALGADTASCRSSLLAGRRALSSLELFPSRYSQLLFGEIKVPTGELKKKWRVSHDGVTRTSLLALHALEEARHTAELTEKELQSPRTADL